MCQLLVVGILLLIQLKGLLAITCINFSGSAFSPFRTNTYVTGPGDACCPVSAMAGSLYGITYKPYNSSTEMCCKSDSYTIGSIIYQQASIGKGNACCGNIAYINSTNAHCCYDYNLKTERNFYNVGEGDTCCGLNAYFGDKQSCCKSYLVGMQIYTVADGCCGVNGYNKTYEICCNTYNIGNGNACCNYNGFENAHEEADAAYYKESQCCQKGKVVDHACASASSITNKGILCSSTCLLQMLIFYLKIQLYSK